MPQRTIAIGDIHGCSRALAALLEEIDPTDGDTIVTLGDYVDRGPDSRGVIEQLHILRDRSRLVPLIGNHEVMMLDALDQGGDRLQYWLACGGRETLESYGGDWNDVPEEHLGFLRGLLPYFEAAQHIFVHANYHPENDMSEQPDYLLYWEHINYTPHRSTGLRGHRRRDRWVTKSPIRPGPHKSGKTVFVGHTPQRSGEILDLDHIVCIDTGCAYGGWLTAIDVETREFWQADLDGNLR